MKRLTWQYWYELVHFIQTILSTIKLREKMHFDMIQIVDEFTELWHSRVWNFFIRFTSDDICYTSNHNIIIFEDILSIVSTLDTCRYQYERVIFIDRDYRQHALELDMQDDIILEF